MRSIHRLAIGHDITSLINVQSSWCKQLPFTFHFASTTTKPGPKPHVERARAGTQESTSCTRKIPVHIFCFRLGGLISDRRKHASIGMPSKGLALKGMSRALHRSVTDGGVKHAETQPNKPSQPNQRRKLGVSRASHRTSHGAPTSGCRPVRQANHDNEGIDSTRISFPGHPHCK